MNGGLLVGLLAVTSVLGWVLTARRREPRLGLRAVGLELCEFAALWVLCLAANLALGIAMILAVRMATPLFISMYVLNDVSLAVASGLQAFVVYRRRRRASSPAVRRCDRLAGLGSGREDHQAGGPVGVTGKDDPASRHAGLERNIGSGLLRHPRAGPIDRSGR
jgi:hypothetical protein